jgi:hypothetical protein
LIPCLFLIIITRGQPDVSINCAFRVLCVINKRVILSHAFIDWRFFFFFLFLFFSFRLFRIHASKRAMLCPWDRSRCCWRILLAQITFGIY